MANMCGVRPFSVLHGVGSNEVDAIRLASEHAVDDERVEKYAAAGLVEVPQARGLRGRQFESWHFPELAADPLEHYRSVISLAARLCGGYQRRRWAMVWPPDVGEALATGINTSEFHR